MQRDAEHLTGLRNDLTAGWRFGSLSASLAPFGPLFYPNQTINHCRAAIW